MTEKQKTILAWVATAIGAAAVIFGVIGMTQAIIDSIINH